MPALLMNGWMAVLFLLPTGAFQNESGGRVRSFEDPPFTMVVPDSYEELTPSPKQTLATYYRYLSNDPSDSMVFSVTAYTNVFSREDNSAEGLREYARKNAPEGAEVTIVPVFWGRHELNAFRIVMVRNGEERVVWGVQVPVAPRGIVLNMAAPVRREDKIRTDLPELLRGLKGKSNWDTEPTTVPAEPGPYKDLPFSSSHLILAIVATIGFWGGWGMFLLYFFGYVAIFGHDPLKLTGVRIGWLITCAILLALTCVASMSLRNEGVNIGGDLLSGILAVGAIVLSFRLASRAQELREDKKES